jgi:hypothetical protein
LGLPVALWPDGMKMIGERRLFSRRAEGSLLFAVGFCLSIAAFLISVGICHSSQMEVRLEGQRVRILAQQVPLIEVLKELSRQAVFLLSSDDPMDEMVTLDIHAASLEGGIRQLLSQRNHTIHYVKLADGKIKIAEIRVLGASPTMSASSRVSQIESQNSPQEQLWFDPPSYKKVFSNKAELGKQIKLSKMELPISQHPPGTGGLQVTEVASDSIFSRLGIVKGDILHNVNGAKVSDINGLIIALQSSPESGTAIRIERHKADGKIDPIYIYVDTNRSGKN